MSKWRFWSWKTLSLILTIILVPLFIGLIGNYITWFGTKEKKEITLSLDGWITIGTLQESGLEELKLTYNGEPVNNAMKISWWVANTGSKGISEFEIFPFLEYPKTPNVNIVEARVSEASPALRIKTGLLINSKDRKIQVNDMGIFNEGEFFRVDVYILDIPEFSSLSDYLKDWNLVAKAVDLKIKKDIISEVPPEEAVVSRMEFWILVVFMTIFLITWIFPAIRDPRRRRDKEEE